MNTWLSAVAAARAVSATAAGGDAVAVVTIVAGPGAGRRLLVRESGGEPDGGRGVVTGSLGSVALDSAARALGLRALVTGGTLLETIPEGDSSRSAPAQSSGALGVTAEPRSPSAFLRASPNAQGQGAGAPVAVTLYAEAHHPPEELVIVGAGHISVPLAELGVRLGYRVVILDDREEFATTERFPAAATVLRTDFADPFRAVRIRERSHVVLVTRAHKYDYDCLLRLLAADVAPRYIGMIGSRRRVRATFLALLEAGVPRERIGLVRAPVGLEIGAETPEEIAVSVAAELIMLRRGVLDAAEDTTAGGDKPRTINEPRAISDRERVLERLLPDRASTHTTGVANAPNAYNSVANAFRGTTTTASQNTIVDLPITTELPDAG